MSSIVTLKKGTHLNEEIIEEKVEVEEKLGEEDKEEEGEQMALDNLQRRRRRIAENFKKRQINLQLEETIDREVEIIEAQTNIQNMKKLPNQKKT